MSKEIEGSLTYIESIPYMAIRESSTFQKPRFTIAIPTYKRANLLVESIRSALQFKSRCDYDVLIVDNNPESGDETERAIASIDSDIISYYKNLANIGMCGNWNRLFTLAKGEWVIMLHDDDLLYDNYFDVISYIIDSSIDIKCILPAKESNFHPTQLLNEILYYRVTSYDYLYFGNVAPPSGMCILRDAFFQSGGFTNQLYPSIDFYFNSKLCQSVEVVKIEKPITLFYRVEDNESMKENTLKGFIQSDRVIRAQLLETLPKILRWLFSYKLKNVEYYYIRNYNKKFNKNYVLTDVQDKNTLFLRGYSYIFDIVYRLILKLRQIKIKF